MDHFKRIYQENADKYHQMIAAEDTDGNLQKKLEEIVSFIGKRVLDIGSGTGRIPLIMVEKVGFIVCSDLNIPMLTEQCRHRNQTESKWSIVSADNFCLPYRDECADIVTAGWTIGHFIGWYPKDWNERVGLVLREMERVLEPGGVLIIMETMTTGSNKPAPPNKGLAEYYSWLENDWGYQRSVIQTDYQFESVDDAVKLTEFFFGHELSVLIRENQWARLPEWTGIWYKKL